MGSTIGDVLPAAVGVALSPLPIVAVILMLFTRRARVNSVAFLAGWVIALAVIGGLALALLGGTGVAEDDGAPSTTTGVVKAVLAALLLAGAVHNWRTRPRAGEEPPTPRWMAAIDELRPGGALGLAALLAGPNPKNLALNLAAVSTIAAAGLSSGEQVGVFAVFVVLASVTVAVPVVGYVVAGDRADAALASAKDWLLANNQVVMAVLLVVFAAKLGGDALAILAS